MQPCPVPGKKDTDYLYSDLIATTQSMAPKCPELTSFLKCLYYHFSGLIQHFHSGFDQNFFSDYSNDHISFGEWEGLRHVRSQINICFLHKL